MSEHVPPPRPEFDDPKRERAAWLVRALEESSPDPLARRDFLARMGAAIALAGLGACTRAPREEIVPYVVQPTEVRPGVPRFYATASTLDGYATGLIVESHTGRPTKIEGNPDHPASLGAAGAFEQASVLSLYDPTRAPFVTRGGATVAWETVTRALLDGAWFRDFGRGLHVHLEATSSPTLLALIDEMRHRYPQVTVSFDHAARVNAWSGARLAFGRVLEPRYAIEQADVILAFDSDFLASGPSSLRHARHFADRRVAPSKNRLYVVEPLVTVTGANADHRLSVPASDVLAIAAAVARGVNVPLPGGIPQELSTGAARHRSWIDAVVRDLGAHPGRSVVLVGDAQPPEVHALAHALNAALGNLGHTVNLARSPIGEAGEHGSNRLHDSLAAGNIDTLIVCGGNPVYGSAKPAELTELVRRARQSAYLGLHDDETAAACTFTIARAHALESWGDTRAFDGTVSIVQPLIEPLFGGRTELDVLALLARGTDVRAYDLLRSRYRDDRAWRAALRRGVVDGTAIPAVAASVDSAAISRALGRMPSARISNAGSPAGELELVSRHDPHVYDGRFANNAWLLELPSPIEKLTWTNAATLSVETARKLGVVTGDEVELRAGGGAAVRSPVVIVPGQADGTVGLSLGWGRTRGAELATGRGANAWLLGGSTVTITKTRGAEKLPITQTQRRLEGRDREILGKGKSVGEKRRQLTLYDKEPRPSSWQWGMAIDLARCTGCGACVVACQAENNVPTVGPDGVVLNREMHWLRIDSYLTGDPAAPKVEPQPMLCQHCERAPCEYVCPVNATVHSPDGLNEMVYNRCVGTRFCSNNCPYKVRRFNWFDYHRAETKTRELVHNPDVTVRERGVMEKCTFCVQRVRQWEIKKRQGRPAPAPRAACQQTCPTQAIVFGDLRASGSEVRRLHDDERAFKVLDERGTEPRVRYLARVGNPNPELG